MSFQKKHIIIIDNLLADSAMSDYFVKLGYELIHYKQIPSIKEIKQLPYAFLMHYTLIEKDLSLLKPFCRETVPLLIIHERKDDQACIQTLEAGADDFIIKPLHPRELLARIGAVRRRIQRSMKKLEPEKEVLLFANWRVYTTSRQVLGKDNQELILSANEYDLLLTFLRKPQQIIRREALLANAKQQGSIDLNRKIDVQISRLRQKIEQDPRHPKLIKTIRNGGYMCTVPVSTTKI